MRSGWARKLHAEFRLNVQSGGFRIVPVGPDILERSIVLAERCIMSRTPVFLRTLDGIHLATAFHLGCSSIATADIRMKKAAKILGLPVAAP
jgi:predicted nucleic acid-binding protein